MSVLTSKSCSDMICLVKMSERLERFMTAMVGRRESWTPRWKSLSARGTCRVALKRMLWPGWDVPGPVRRCWAKAGITSCF
ncbi:hypothetical protein FKM82_026000 [Ascaphus truei]